MAAVNEVYQARFYCVCGPQTSINVRHFKLISFTGTPPQESTFAASLVTQFSPLYTPLLQVGTTFHGVDIHRVDPLPLGATHSSSTPGSGAVAGDPLPMQICGFIRLKSVGSGRHANGKCYVPFPSEADSSTLPTAVPIASYITRLTALANAFKNTLTFGVIGNQWTAFFGNFELPARIFTLTDTATAVAKWATQRRRGSFGRPNSPPF